MGMWFGPERLLLWEVRDDDQVFCDDVAVVAIV